MDSFLNKNKPLITVITVVRNDRENIQKTVESVLNQKFDKFEYIIIDGKSTDGTIDIINKYKDQIDIIISEPDNGIYDAMNKGIKLSSGIYLNFLNSGDYYINDEILNEIALNVKDDLIDFVYGSILIEYSGQHIRREIKRIFSKKYLRSGKQPPHPASFLKKSEIVKAKCFNTEYKYSADFDLFCKLNTFNIKSKLINKQIAIFSSGGASSSMQANYETKKILKNNYGLYFSAKYIFLKNMERNLKKIANNLRILNLYRKFKKIFIR